MMHQAFLVTLDFNAAPHQPMAQSWSTAEIHSAPSGRECQSRDRLLLSSPPVRADKIAQLWHAVESGHYCVSAEQIAEKMVSEALAAVLSSGLRQG